MATLFLICITYDKYVQYRNLKNDATSLLEPEWIFYESLYEALIGMLLYVLVVLIARILKNFFEKNDKFHENFTFFTFVGVSTIGFYGILIIDVMKNFRKYYCSFFDYLEIASTLDVSFFDSIIFINFTFSNFKK